MADRPQFRLVFMLPRTLGLLAPGTHPPSADGCVIAIESQGLVTVRGPSRRQIFDHVTPFLRRVARGRPPCAITAVVITPSGYYGRPYGGRDGWTIMLNAELAFAPTGVGVEMPSVSIFSPSNEVEKIAMGEGR